VDLFLNNVVGLLALEVALDAFDNVALHGAHVIANVADAHGLEERDERLLIHVQLLGDLIHPNFAHAPRSTFT
jgi:hypothetical protein